jgi:16S rRNA (guanine527-N7)-methyltransferase
MTAPLADQLTAGAQALGLALTPEQAAKLLAYLNLLAQWNKVYNLTAVRDPAEMLTHHLLDSLAAIAPLRRQTQGQPVRLPDVGSGGGLPGAVIAICCPEIAVTCLDAVAKKTAFIQQAAGTLGLPNLRGLHGRVEALRDAFDIITSRAFATLADFTGWSSGALAAGGVWMAMKGKHPAHEIAALPLAVEVVHVEQLAVPGLEAERCLVRMRLRG